MTIKKVTGFMSSDGKLHDTQKQAMDHERDIKVKAAIGVLAGTDTVHLSDGEGGGPLADYLFNNRTAILAAFNQEVRLRRPYARKKKAVADPAPAQQAL